MAKTTIERPGFLLSRDVAKIRKGKRMAWLTGALYLSSSDSSGIIDLCPHSTAGCRAACLGHTAGKMPLGHVQDAQRKRTRMLVEETTEFLSMLFGEIAALEADARDQGMRACARLNGASDLDWTDVGRRFPAVPREMSNVVASFPSVQFYGYTKSKRQVDRFLDGDAPANLHLTYSYAEGRWSICEDVLGRGGNVAVVFRERPFPRAVAGYEVISGDETDLRFLDPPRRVVALKAKGPQARRDATGFVVD
jgi:hypothetical protein